MNGLFGNLQMSKGQPVHPDVAAAMGAGMGHPVQEPGMGNGPPPQQAATPNAMSPDQQALNDWLAQQEQAKQAPKYSVGDLNLDKYINMFLP